MNWKSINETPTGYGWYAVAVLPRNHSGSDESEKNKTDLNGDNSWRKSFGFSKAWLNNGEWYEQQGPGGTKNITRFVTHWDELPTVPELTEPFIHNSNWKFNEPLQKEKLRELAGEQWERDQKTNPNPVNPDAYSYGFLSALRLFGFTGA